MKIYVVLIATLIILVVGTSCSPTPRQVSTPTTESSSTDKLILILSLDHDVYRLGDQILAELMIKNLNGPLVVNKRMAANSSFAHEKFRDVSFSITNSLGQLFELNELIEVNPLSDFDFVLLRGLEGVMASYPDVGYHFRLKTPGEYTIQARYENQSDPGDGRVAWKGVLYSNIVKFTIKP